MSTAGIGGPPVLPVNLMMKNVSKPEEPKKWLKGIPLGIGTKIPIRNR
jgi:hypothetical protein